MQLEVALQQAGLAPLPFEALARFETYMQLLLKWNARMNLTAIRGPFEIARRHFLECIQCAQALPKIPNASLLDYGSGAGFPGIPIAICRPEIRVTLAESQRKKAAFLREAVRRLNLNAEVYDSRVEQMPVERQFSFTTLRAVDKMREAAMAAMARIAPGGWIVLFATEKTESELKAGITGVEWSPGLRVSGTNQGLIMMGQLAG